MKKKNIRLLIIILAIIALIAVVFSVITSSWADKRVKERLEREFYKQSDGQYNLKINDLSISLLTMSIQLQGVQVVPVELSEKDAVYTFTMSSLELEGVGLFGYLFRKNLDIESLNIQDPSVKITRGSTDYQTATDTTKSFSLYGFVKSFARSLTLQDIRVIDFDLIFYDSRSEETPTIHSTDNSFRIKNFHIGPSTAELPGYFEADSILLVMNDFEYTQPDSLYTLKVNNLNASFKDSLLMLDSITFVPNYSKMTFSNVVGKQTDRFTISARQLTFRKIDLPRLLEHHSFIAQHTEIKRFQLNAFRDKNKIREYKKPPALQAILKEMPLYLKLDTIEMDSAFVSYEEVAKGNNIPGKLTFNNISAKFTGVTNDSVLSESGKELVFRASCLFMNESKMNAEYRFPLNTRLMEFYCNGSLGRMPVEPLNKALKPLAGIAVSEGEIDTLVFSFHAREDATKGTMKFLYHNLKLSSTDQGPKGETLGGKIKVFLANNFILRKNNPSGDNPPKEASLYYERNKQRFMFNYTWKTLYSGIHETLGMPGDSNKK